MGGFSAYEVNGVVYECKHLLLNSIHSTLWKIQKCDCGLKMFKPASVLPSELHFSSSSIPSQIFPTGLFVTV